jgi:hypothetical protein
MININGRTPEEIKRRLKCASFDCGAIDCDDCECSDLCKSLDVFGDTANALAYIQHLEAQQPKWIKLTEDDRPPDGYYNVMVKKRGVWQRDLLRYDANDDDWWKELGTHDELVPGYLITHWMPLPEPPEEADHAD